MEETKKCPYCGEEILAEAKKCKHCGEWLENKPVSSVPDKNQNNNARPQMPSSEDPKGAVENVPVKEKLLKAIQTYINSHQVKSKYVFLLDEINGAVLDRHKKLYAHVTTDEKPLLAVNNKIIGVVGGYGWSGLLITDKKLYYKCTVDKFWASIIALANKGEMPLESIRKIAIGESDGCFGTSYIGHRLIINKKTVGLLRMGGAITWNDETINELTQIFKQL